MLRIAVLGAMLMATVPTMAEARHVKGEQDKIPFDYTADLDRHENVIFRGTYTDTGEHFVFTVSPGGHVDGSIGPNAVSFDVAPELRDRVVAELHASEKVMLAQQTPTH